MKPPARPPPARPRRALAPGDEARLQEFFHSHTLETIYERYGGLVTTMTAERAHELVGVDQSRDCALAFFSPDGRQIHAVGRYCLNAAGDAAELAFVVREDQRRQGLATSLLRELTAVARARGLRRLWAQVNASNTAMLALFRRHGFHLAAEPGAVVKATLFLAPASASAHP